MFSGNRLTAGIDNYITKIARVLAMWIIFGELDHSAVTIYIVTGCSCSWNRLHQPSDQAVKCSWYLGTAGILWAFRNTTTIQYLITSHIPAFSFQGGCKSDNLFVLNGLFINARRFYMLLIYWTRRLTRVGNLLWFQVLLCDHFHPSSALRALLLFS